MILDKRKVLIALAETGLSTKAFCESSGVRYYTFRRALAGEGCKPSTAGRIAKALKVPVSDIIA